MISTVILEHSVKSFPTEKCYCRLRASPDKMQVHTVRFQYETINHSLTSFKKTHRAQAGHSFHSTLWPGNQKETFPSGPRVLELHWRVYKYGWCFRQWECELYEKDDQEMVLAGRKEARTAQSVSGHVAAIYRNVPLTNQRLMNYQALKIDRPYTALFKLLYWFMFSFS